MAAPVITLTNSASAVITSINYGNIDAGSVSAPQNILIWNNYNGANALSDAQNVTLTTKTYNGQNSNDTIPNGQEVVTNLSFALKCNSQGDVNYTNIGGLTTAPIGSTLGGVGIIKGVVNGDAASCFLTLQAPTNVTAGAVQFLMRINYLYS